MVWILLYKNKGNSGSNGSNTGGFYSKELSAVTDVLNGNFYMYFNLYLGITKFVNRK